MFQRTARDASTRAPRGPLRPLQSLRFLFTAGAAIPVEVIRDFERHGLVLKQGYGQTETSILCCLDARDALRKAGSVGRPVTHAELRVRADSSSLDGPPEAWEDADVGETGEIVVPRPDHHARLLAAPRGDGRDPARRVAAHRTTSPRVDDEGFVTLVGRARDMYISGGENVYPAEIEAVYESTPRSARSRWSASPDPRWGESGRAYVRARSPARRSTPNALLAWGERAPRALQAAAASSSPSTPCPAPRPARCKKHRLLGAEDAAA